MASLESILGHTAQINELQTDIAQGNVAHAYLFSGPPHLGKFTIAKWFATELLTQGRDEEQQKTTRDQIDRLLHPDLLVIDQLWMEDTNDDLAVIAESSNISQQHRMKAKAKTDTISIDDIRALQERLHDVGTGAFRCCLIRSAERMQNEAVNSLLKILEEPPQGMVFILTTQAFSQLLPTLVSRTRTMNFLPLTDAQLEPLLTDASDDERQFLFRVAQGAPGIVKNLRDNPDLLRMEKQVYASALAFWHSRSNVERLQLIAPLHERGAAAEQFLLHLSLALREEREDVPATAIRHLLALGRDMETNVNRQLLTQKFVLALSTST